MKKKRAAGILVIVLLTVILLVVWILPLQQESVPEFVLTYAENQTSDYPTTMAAYRFSKMVEERTNGRIKILVQSGGALGDEKSVIHQMQFGGVDFMRVSLAQLSEYIPETTILQMPYLYTDSEHMWRVLDGKIGDKFLALIDESDLIGLSWYDAGARNFYNSVRPITSLTDIQGLNIRVQEASIMIDIVQALGATAIPYDYANVYSAIEQGKVDGAENNWPSYEAMGHYEVAGYYTVNEHTRVPEVQLCSGVTWSKLSPKDQAVIRECAVESALYQRKLWQQREIEARQIAIDNGVRVTELSEEEKKIFQAAVVGVYEKYCGDYLEIVAEIIEEGDH